MTAFPNDLPLPRANGAGWNLGKGGSRFETDSAIAKQRATTTAAVGVLSLVYRCTKAQMETLAGPAGFYYGAAGQGGVWFDFTHPFTGAAGQARFMVGQEPKITAVPPKFDVAVTLEFIG